MENRKTKIGDIWYTSIEKEVIIVDDKNNENAIDRSSFRVCTEYNYSDITDNN